MRKWPANLASNSSLLLGTILFVEGTNVQQGQWTLILSPRFLSKREKEIIFPREGNNSQPPLLHQAVSIRWNFWMNSLTSERHPLLHSLCDVDRKPCPLGARLYCSRVDVPLRRCLHVVRFENLWVWRETNHKLIWLTHSFICCSISCTVRHENTSCKCDESTRADAVTTVQTHCSSLEQLKLFVWKNHRRSSYLVYFHALLCGACLWVWSSEDAKFCFDQSTGISLHVGDVEAHYPEVRALRKRVDWVCGTKAGFTLALFTLCGLCVVFGGSTSRK